MTGCVLSASRLFDPALPAEWAGVLEELAELDELRHAADVDVAKRRAGALHARLMEGAAILEEPTPEDLPASGASSRVWFTESVLLWIRLAATSSPPLVDTLGTRSLLDFPLDLPDEASAASGPARVRTALREALGWSEQDFAEVERGVDQLTSNLPLKRRITRALADLLAEGDRLSPRGRADLMRSFYGPVPWRPGDVDLVMTSTAIFFCVPAADAGARLDVSGFDDRPEEERRAIAAFLEALDAANVAETTRFPSFGPFDPRTLDPALASALTCDAPPEIALATLATMVSILRSSQVERYLVHDAWGHTWQEALVDMEWEYAALPGIDEPLYRGRGIEEAFADRGGRTELDEAALLRFADADLRAHIQAATSAVLSEMLADCMECKYARKRPAYPLPSSSLLPDTALKLDLTLADVRRQLRRWAKPYRSLAEDEGTRARLAEVLGRSRPEPGLREAVDRAGLLLARSFAPAFDETLRPEPAAEDGSIRSSVLRRVVLQLTRIAAAIERVLDASSRSAASSPPDPPWLDPGSCPDLFVVTLARLYEHDHQANFWHLDRIMATEFSPACRRLADALDALDALRSRALVDTSPRHAESAPAMSETQTSPRREELSPLFTGLIMSADDANAIVAALRDVAEVDGVHDEELAMIAGFVEALDADLGAAEPTSLGPMTPAKLAAQLLDPELRTVAVQCAVLLAMADGAISDKERARVTEYASALGVTGERYAEIERLITSWVKSGDMTTIL